MKLRPSVLRFAEMMEKNLLSNDHKGGWDDCDSIHLEGMLEDEMVELKKSLKIYQDRRTPVSKRLLEMECADLANFAMMLSELRLQAKAVNREGS